MDLPEDTGFLHKLINTASALHCLVANSAKALTQQNKSLNEKAKDLEDRLMEQERMVAVQAKSAAAAVRIAEKRKSQEQDEANQAKRNHSPMDDKDLGDEMAHAMRFRRGSDARRASERESASAAFMPVVSQPVDAPLALCLHALALGLHCLSLCGRHGRVPYPLNTWRSLVLSG